MKRAECVKKKNTFNGGKQRRSDGTWEEDWIC